MSDDIHFIEQKKDELADSLVFSIIHDLKNMMVPIMSRAEMLLLPGLSDERRNYLVNQMYAGCFTLMGAMNNMVRICKDRNGIGEIHLEPVNLNFLVTEAIDVLDESSLAKSIKVVNDVAEGFIVNVDRESILTVFINLIGNAIKFTHSGGSIRVYSAEEDDKVRVFIEDTGIGIDVDKIKALIENNQYFTTPGTNGEVGTGFGLMLCVSHLMRHQSILDYCRNDSGGSTFSFLLGCKND